MNKLKQLLFKLFRIQQLEDKEIERLTDELNQSSNKLIEAEIEQENQDDLQKGQN